MDSDLDTYCLSSSTSAEALVNGWYAYAYTMAPAAAALHLVNYQLKVLDSYLSSPELHAQASNDKAMLGGPFVAIPIDQRDEVAAFREHLAISQTSSIDFAKAYLSFESLLMREAQGYSIESFYERMPSALRGLCELGYDYRDRPILRVLESIAYRSSIGRERKGCLLLDRCKRDGERSFFLSTPRLPCSGVYQWHIDLADARIDEFFSLETNPRPLGEVAEILGAGADLHALRPLLSPSEEIVPLAPGWTGSSPRIRYFGHACVLIEHAGVSILCDPNIPVVPASGGVERLSFRDLPSRIDFVLITHSHADHFLPEALVRLRRRIGTLVVPRNHGIFLGDASLALIARRLRIPVVEVEAYDELRINDGRIVATPFFGEHCDLLHAKTAYVIMAGRSKVLLAADSNYLDRHIYEDLRSEYGEIDTVFLGMECHGAPLRWQYGSLLPGPVRHDVSESRRLNGCDADRAVPLVSALGAQRCFVYAMGREPWLEHLMALAPSDDSKQMAEARNALARLHAENQVHGEILSGPFDFVLNP